MKQEMIIGCIPVSAQPTPPRDQKNCVIEPCPQCNTDMWVSEKKRALRSDKIPCVCMICAAKAMVEHGVDFDMLDLNKRH